MENNKIMNDGKENSLLSMLYDEVYNSTLYTLEANGHTWGQIDESRKQRKEVFRKTRMADGMCKGLIRTILCVVDFEKVEKVVMQAKDVAISDFYKKKEESNGKY